MDLLDLSGQILALLNAWRSPIDSPAADLNLGPFTALIAELCLDQETIAKGFTDF